MPHGFTNAELWLSVVPREHEVQLPAIASVYLQELPCRNPDTACELMIQRMGDATPMRSAKIGSEFAEKVCRRRLSESTGHRLWEAITRHSSHLAVIRGGSNRALRF